MVEPVPIKFIFDPVRIEIFKEKRSYQVPAQVCSFLPQGESSAISKNIVLQLDDEAPHIELIARTKAVNPIVARRICEDEIDKVITSLSMIYDSNVLGNSIWVNSSLNLK